MKNCFVKALSLITSVAIISSVIAGCSDYSDNDAEDDIVFFEMKCDSEVSYNAKGEFTVNIGIDNTTFAEYIDSNDVKVFYSDINFSKLPDVDAAEAVMLKDGEYKTVYADVTSVSSISDHSASVTFNDKFFGTNRPDCFFIYCNENTNTSANRYLSMVTVRYPTYSLVSDTTQVYSNNKTDKFKLTLDKSTFASDILVEDILLSGGFEGCTVSELDRTGDNMLSLVIKSEDGYKSGKDGFITVKHSAVTDASVDISVSVGIISPQVIFSSSSFEASTNYAKATIKLMDCLFVDSVTAESFSCNNSGVQIARFDRVSGSEGILYLSIDDKTPDEVIDIISNCSFSVDDTALNISIPLSFVINPYSPDVTGNIAEIQESGSNFSVTAEFTVTDGVFNVISKNSFIFGGDYAKAVISSITAQDNSATVCFDIPKTSSAETAELYGTIGLRTGAVLSRWGTQSAIAPFPLYYSAEQSRAENKTQYNENLVTMLSALSEYDADFSDDSISAIMNINIEEEPFKKYFIPLSDSFGEIYNLLENTELMVSYDNIPLSIQNEESFHTVNRYLHDIKTLYATVNTLNSSLARLISIEEQITSAKDVQELDSLNAEKNEISARIIATYTAKIKGKSFSQLLIDVINSYCDENGALVCYDRISDSNYNWHPQSINDKNMFRKMSYSIIINAAVIECYSEPLSENENSGAVIKELSNSLKRLSEFAKVNVIDNLRGSAIYSTTLGRLFSLVKFDSVLNDPVKEISISEITQLENMLGSGETLSKELDSVGFDISSVRYLVCADSNITGRAEKINDQTYSFVSRATLYDISTSKTENELEFSNYYYKIQINEEGAPVAIPYVNKYYQLYTLK